MIGKTVILFGALLLILGLSACGTIQIDVADEDQEGEVTVAEVEGTPAVVETASPTQTIAEQPLVESTATPQPPAETPDAAVQDAPAEWQRFDDDSYGVELWHPPGTTALIGQPARPVFSSVKYPDGIAEDQVFVVRVMNDEGGPFGPSGPQVILEVKLVANPQEENAAVMAERFGQRCPGGPPDSLQPTTFNVQLSGFRYGCEGIDGIIFNEFWAPHPGDSQLLFGAVWAEMSAPLSDQILATVGLNG